MKNFLSQKRKELGLTQPQVAELAQLSNYTVLQGYENGRHEPTVSVAIRLARALNTTVEELFQVED